MSEPNKENKLHLDLSRDLSMAISEYAPGSQIVADGNLITSEYIRRVQNKEWKRYDFIYCDCKTLNLEPYSEFDSDDRFKVCKACGQELDKRKKKTFLIPEFGFESTKVEKATLIKPKKTYHGEIAYVGYRDEIESQNYEKEGYKYQVAFSQNDEMAVINQASFYICNACGYTYLSEDGFSSVMEKMHKRPNGYECGNKLLRRTALGYRFETDVIKIRFSYPRITEFNEAISILYGIMRGACISLNIEEKDIDGCVQYFEDSITFDKGYELILYDKTPGGSGHVKKLKDIDVFTMVLKKTYQIMHNCSCGGTDMDTSCYNCLRSYSNQRMHDILQRGHVVRFLEKVIS